ncbi:MAG: phosphate ABC transporter permease PstA [Clostridia bacterium]
MKKTNNSVNGKRTASPTATTIATSTPHKKQFSQDKLSKLGFQICAMFSIFAVVAIIGYILYASVPALRQIGLFHFLFGNVWAPTKEFLPASARFGIFPMIISSLAVTFGALLLGGVVGVFTAIFLVFFCPKKLKGLFIQIINLLAGIPSIIYGFFGLVVLAPLLGNISPNGSGKGLLASSIILGIMILPTVASITRNALEAVPKSYFEGALALGATKEQTIFKIIVPAAKSGIVTALALGVGRAIGETMAVMMIAGNSPLFPTGMFTSIRTLTTNIVLEMSYSTGLHRSALIATGFVLLIFVLLLNISLGLIKKNSSEKTKKQSKSASAIASSFFKHKHNSTNLSSTLVASQSASTALSASGTQSASTALSTSASQSTSTMPTQCAPSYGDNSAICVFTQRGKIQKTLKYISYVIATIVAAVLSFIIIFVLAKGLPHITFNLLFGKSGNATMTLQPAFISTTMLIVLSLAIALPIGIGSAIYLVEYAKKGSKFVKIIRLFTDTLAGIPSIVFGLFGMIVFCGAFGGTSLLAGGFTMAIIILPTIIRSTEESLMAVPDSLREGSLALGASKLRTIFKIVLPSAINGILTSIVLAIGRIVGESAALIYTAGAVAYTPLGYMEPGSSFAVMMWMFAGEGLYINSAYATAAVLLIIVATLNALVYLLEVKMKKKQQGNSASKDSFFAQILSSIKDKKQKRNNKDTVAIVEKLMTKPKFSNFKKQDIIVQEVTTVTTQPFSSTLQSQPLNNIATDTPLQSPPHTRKSSKAITTYSQRSAQ